jgi:hypothetical protein
MTAEEIIRRAAADRVIVRVSDNGKLKAKGENDAIGRWLPLLRQHKAEITKLIMKGQGVVAKPARTINKFCQDYCPDLESLTLPGEGPVLGCADPLTGSWTRLDRLASCPARKLLPVIPLPEWCSPGCERYTRLDLPGGDVRQWCAEVTDATHWSYTRIDAMTACPLKAS